MYGESLVILYLDDDKKSILRNGSCWKLRSFEKRISTLFCRRSRSPIMAIPSWGGSGRSTGTRIWRWQGAGARQGDEDAWPTLQRDRPPHKLSVWFWEKRITNIKTNLPEPRPLREELELSGRNDSVHQGQKHVGDNKCFVFNIQFVGGIDNERWVSKRSLPVDLWHPSNPLHAPKG